jgi:hypothetical protein
MGQNVIVICDPLYSSRLAPGAGTGNIVSMAGGGLFLTIKITWVVSFLTVENMPSLKSLSFTLFGLLLIIYKIAAITTKIYEALAAQIDSKTGCILYAYQLLCSHRCMRKVKMHFLLLLVEALLYLTRFVRWLARLLRI